MAILVLGGAAIFWWQRSQIAGLRAQVALQGAALEDNRERVAELSLGPGGEARGHGYARALPAQAIRPFGADLGAADVRADERRVILGQYRDALAELNLPAATAIRLEDLLTDRIEAFLDAQDAARRQGFAEGSAETERAVALAIADDDREIAELLRPEADRRLGRLRTAGAPEDQAVPEPAAPQVAVTVLVQAPAPQTYADVTEQPSAPDAYVPSPYYFFPVSRVLVPGGLARPRVRAQPGALRGLRPPSVPRTHRG